MKTIYKLIFILFVSIIYTSCDNESTNNSIENSEQLTSIEEVFLFNDNPTGQTNTYTIENGLNTQIDYSLGNYQLQTFTDGKVTMIEYYNNNLVTGTQVYTYDSNDRIINDISSNPPNNVNVERNYEYVGNQILGITTYTDNDGVVTSVDEFAFTLNDNNQIIHYQNEANTVSWDASYINGNLSEFSANGYGNDVDGLASFTYAIDDASIPYQKERYRYGTQWRNNILLNQTGTYSFKQLAELGTNYLTSYVYVVNSDSTRVITLLVDYEFDNLGRLTKQTKNKMFFQSPQDRVLTYQYE